MAACIVYVHTNFYLREKERNNKESDSFEEDKKRMNFIDPLFNVFFYIIHL